MFFKKISLKNFRNVPEAAIEFHPGFNLFLGANAQGKTNLLEAIYLFAFGGSFRIRDYRGLIQKEKGEALLRASVQTSLGEEERAIQLDLEKKNFLRDGKKTMPNQFSSMPLVLFAPETISLLKGSPEARREYTDLLLTKISPSYGDALKKYKRALNQRNRLLKDENVSLEEKRRQMVFWEGPLAEYGNTLIAEREKWLSRLNSSLQKHYNTIAGEASKEVRFLYNKNVSMGDFEKGFNRRREEEIIRGVTLVGPHRDDISPCLGGEAIKTVGSQGELRTFTLALKLAEIGLFEEVLGNHPILLLDDVLSELDAKRSLFFFNYLTSFKGQIFATATSIDLFPRGSLKEFLSWEVSKGGFSKGKPFTF